MHINFFFFRARASMKMIRLVRAAFWVSILAFGGVLVVLQNKRLPQPYSDGDVRTVSARSLGACSDDRTQVKDLRTRVYKERVSYAMSQCHNQQKHKVATSIKHDQYKLAYCKVPKVGCTFWMRMLLYLYNDTGGTPVKSPFEIPRMFVHLGKKKHLQIRRDFPKIENQLTNYTRFMFTRDPFSRLWSAYLDKFRLPDFWRWRAFNVKSKRKVIPDKSKRCRNGRTFEEFLQFVVSQKPETMNEHWQPISYQCDPCLFKPTVIGKVETFNEDARHILSNIGQEKTMSSFNIDTYVEQELAMLTEYNFDLLKLPFYKGCLTNKDVALLLWEVFQLNGYLPKEVNAAKALKVLHKINKASFKVLVVNFYRSASKEDKRRWKLQKATALKDAFRAIPKSLSDRVVSIYKDDFVMFGYNSKPPGTL